MSRKYFQSFVSQNAIFFSVFDEITNKCVNPVKPSNELSKITLINSTFVVMDDKNKIKGIPERAYYFPNFITEQEEQIILNNVYSSPKPKWTYLSNRRLQNWGGIPHLKGMIPEDIPKWLDEPMKKTGAVGAFSKEKLPNHVLVNEYLPGQGIMRHLDGPLFYPTICTITCGSHTVLNFHPPQDKNTDCSDSESVLTSILLERRSLIVIQEDLYHLYPHSIEEKYEDEITNNITNLYLCAGEYKINDRLKRETRISLTIRHVPNTSKFKLKLFK